MNKIFIIFLLINSFQNIFIYTYSLEDIKIPKDINNNKTLIYFIKCGKSDSMIIESNGHFGLVDSSKAYKFIEHEVEHVEINETIGEKNHWSKDPDKSVQAVINYLNYLKVDKLDFIIATHSHNDHIGGIPAIAYYFVNENTKYYYREYRKTKEDTSKISLANYKYYLAAVHSMQKKGANLIDVTNKIVNFDFFELNFELLNTDIDPDELKYGENQNSIVTLIKFRKTKILLTADMISKDDKKLKDYVGKIDILKLAHHGKSESSYEFLNVTRPRNTIVTNEKIPTYLNQIINYIKYSLNSRIFITEYVSKSSESVENSAIKLNLNTEGIEYELINTGEELVPNSSVNGWLSWCDKKTYLENGITVKEFQYLEYKEGKDWFYFNQDGIMLTGWQKIESMGDLRTFYFDKNNGNMLLGWQQLEWSGGVNWFYFYPSVGYMAQNCCITIDGKEYCFDENGCLIE